MAERKITVLISSHQLHQVQKICTQVGIFSKGKLVASGPVDQLGREALREGQFNIILPISQPSDKVMAAIKSIPGIINIEGTADSTVIAADKDLSKQIEEAVFDSSGLKVQMRVEKFELEEVYMKYFNEPKQ
jgi:ABC-2 type transport system ATP-binding protein